MGDEARLAPSVRDHFWMSLCFAEKPSWQVPRQLNRSHADCDSHMTTATISSEVSDTVPPSSQEEAEQTFYVHNFSSEADYVDCRCQLHQLPEPWNIVRVSPASG